MELVEESVTQNTTPQQVQQPAPNPEPEITPEPTQTQPPTETKKLSDKIECEHCKKLLSKKTYLYGHKCKMKPTGILTVETAAPQPEQPKTPQPEPQPEPPKAPQPEPPAEQFEDKPQLMEEPPSPPKLPIRNKRVIKKDEPPKLTPVIKLTLTEKLLKIRENSLKNLKLK